MADGESILSCQIIQTCFAWLQIHNKRQNAQLGKRWRRNLCVTATLGWYQWLERCRKLVETEQGKEKEINSDIAVYSLHLQLPSSARSLLGPEGSSVAWRGKMGENNWFETTLKQDCESLPCTSSSSTFNKNLNSLKQLWPEDEQTTQKLMSLIWII